MNLEAARSQMIGQQVRAWEVLDDRVLEVLRSTPRERFVPKGYEELAFADTEIPLGHGQAMMTPKIEGRLLQSLRVQAADDVLEIGTGSGYLTACLAKLGGQVTSIDIFEDFSMAATAALQRERIRNIQLETGDAMTLSYSDRFDAVAVTASAPVLPEHFVDMLRPTGRLFIVIGRAPVMEARLITRSAAGDWTEESLFETLLAPLINVDISEPFTL
jgi:protein-L-isoaspartate(D-aspartate) O-methyltransferase